LAPVDDAQFIFGNKFAARTNGSGGGGGGGGSRARDIRLVA